MRPFLVCLFALSLALLAGSASAATVELVVNPGFEIGTGSEAPPWGGNQWGGTSQAVASTPENPAHSGARMWKFDGGGSPNSFEQVVHLVLGGGVCHFQAYVRVPSASPTNPVNVYFNLWFGNAGNWYVSNYNTTNVPLTSPDWTLVDDQTGGAGVVAPADCNQVIFRIRPASAPAYVDDVSVTAGVFNISGRVVDDTGANIQGATVTLGSTSIASNPVLATVVTGTDGAYSFTAAPGNYYVVARKYLWSPDPTESYPVSVTANNVSVPDFMISKMTTFFIRGRVIDNNGFAVAGADVALNAQAGSAFTNPMQTAITDASGAYSFEVSGYEGTFGQYYVCAKKSGYSPFPTPDQLADIAGGDVSLADFVLTGSNNGLILALKPGDYNPTAKKWTICDGAMVGDYFLSNGGAAELVSYIGNSGFSALKMNYAGNTCSGFAGPLCPDSLGSNHTRTIEAWLYTPATSPNVVFGLSRQYTEDTGGTNLPNGNFAFANGSNSIYCSPDGNNTWGTGNRFGKWTYLVASYNGTTLSTYVDGVVSNTKTFTYNTESGGSMTIGIMRGNHNGAKVATPYSFAQWDGWNMYKGYLGAIRVYDRARSAAQISADYALGVNYGEVPAHIPVISGKVSKSDGSPIEGAVITAADGVNAPLTALTNARGEYHLTVVPNSVYTLKAAKMRFYTSTPQSATVVWADKTVDFTLSADNRGILFAMRPQDYDAVARKWTINDGYLKDDYFLSSSSMSAAAFVPTVSSSGHSGLLINYGSTNCYGFAGPLCPDFLGGSNPRTLEGWVYVPAGVSGGAIIGLSRQYTESAPTNRANGNFALFAGDRALHCQWDPTDAYWGGNAADRQGRWVYYALSYDGATVTMYVDGVQTGTKNFVYNTEPGGSMTIGANRGNYNSTVVSTPYSFSQWDSWPLFSGFLGAIRVYDKARSASEIGADYALGVNYGEAPIVVPTISGRVTLADGITPVSGVKMAVSGGVMPYTGVTDASGNYSISVEPTTALTVTAFKLGYASKPLSRSAVGGATGVNFTLTPAAPRLLVDLQADALAVGSLTSWPNAGELGGAFASTEATSPVVGNVGPARAVTFDGSMRMLLKDALNANIPAPVAITGPNTCYTVAAWLYNPSAADMEWYLGWSRRGGPDGTCAGFGYGTNGGYGAGGHWGWGPDIGFGASVPAEGMWHHIALTYDGVTERVYVDGAESNSEDKVLSFHQGQPVSLGAAYTNSDGTGVFGGFGGSLGSLKVWDQPRSAVDINQEYMATRDSFTITVSGKVTLSDGITPVAGATVVIGSASPSVDAPTATAVTNASGEYSLPAQPNTESYVAAYKAGYEPVPTLDVTVNVGSADVTGINFAIDFVGVKKIVNLKADGLPLGEFWSWSNGEDTIYPGYSFNSDQTVRPFVVGVGNHKAVSFAGASRMIAAFPVPCQMVGNASYTLSAWVYNPMVAPDECFFSWAHRGGLAGSGCGFGFGSSPDSGAVVHTGVADMGFGAVPSAEAWHHIAVTFDGLTETVYVDGSVVGSESKILNISRGEPFCLGAAYSNTNGSGLSAFFSGAIASLEVYDMAQDAATIAGYAANPPPVFVTPEVKGVVTDGVRAIADAVVQIGGVRSPYAVVTDSLGRYSITNPPLGTVEVFADALGYADKTESIETSENMGAITHNIVLTAKPEGGVIVNGGFEEVSAGKPVGWTGSNSGIDWSASTDAFSGSQSLFCTGSVTYACVTQVLDVVPGSTYNCYFKAKADPEVTSWFPMFAFRDNALNEMAGWISWEPGYEGYVHNPPKTWKQYLNFRLYAEPPVAVPFIRIAPPYGATKLTVSFGYEGLPPVGKGCYIDDVVIDRIGPDVAVSVASIAALKAKPNGTLVTLTALATVTYAPTVTTGGARSTDLFYVGQTQGLGGLRVVDKVSDNLHVGDTVTGLTGTVRQTPAGEKYLELSADVTGVGGSAIPVLGMNNKAVATDLRAQTNAVRVWGKAAYTAGATTFTITDGYGSPITVCVNGVTLPAGLDGATAIITGVVSKSDAGTPVILLQEVMLP